MYSLFLRDFNSIKVRLKLNKYELLQARDQFQFHKGTIKTRVQQNQARRSSGFQFHKGTIKTIPLIRDAVGLKNFNSIKVRLKQPSPVSP